MTTEGIDYFSGLCRRRACLCITTNPSLDFANATTCFCRWVMKIFGTPSHLEPLEILAESEADGTARKPWSSRLLWDWPWPGFFWQVYALEGSLTSRNDHRVRLLRALPITPLTMVEPCGQTPRVLIIFKPGYCGLVATCCLPVVAVCQGLTCLAPKGGKPWSWLIIPHRQLLSVVTAEVS